MTEHSRLALTPGAQAWISGTALEPSIDPFVDRLSVDGYAVGTIKGYLGCVAHFAHWTARQQIQLCDFDENVISEFVQEHLPICRCAVRCRRTRTEVRAALLLLLAVLRDIALVPAVRPTLPTGIDSELRRFGSHLTEVRGLQPVTRDTRVCHVRAFLLHCFNRKAVDVNVLIPADIVRFMMSRTVG